MKRSQRIYTFALLYCVAIGNVNAYEIGTHAKITNAAYAKSQLSASDSAIQKRLGIDSWVLGQNTVSAPFRTLTPGLSQPADFYMDMTTNTVFSRQAQKYEFGIMDKNGQGNNALKIPGWLMRGVIREDDVAETVATINVLRSGGVDRAPLDDPYGNINRFCNHFMDPTLPAGQSRGFSSFCFYESPIYDAAQWALGSQAPFVAQPLENTARRNHFTILDAREAMWRALTLKNKDGSAATAGVLTPEQLRKVYWATDRLQTSWV